ncbi:MAG: nucleoside hydrolase, partial [Verrucomicrobiae bacterium]|nr:nucleoside hydrolase [Verrucomicrobiae bacterium]
MAHKVIIDTDPGIGDAIALAIALLDPEIDVLGITATAGCVSGGAATRNVQAIVEHLDPAKWPRIGSSDGQVASTFGTDKGAESITLTDLNGPSGLGDWEFRVADLHHRHESAKIMIDIAKSAPNEVTLLTLGPLTNLELAMERAPDFLQMLKGVVIFGGAISCGGDVTAAAEFNMFANPEAARTVLSSPATKTLVPLDICRQTVLTFEQFDRVNPKDDSPTAQLLEQLLPFAFRAHHQFLGTEGVALMELVALAAIAHPRLFEAEPMSVDVETAGELTTGMTVFDRRGIP